MQRVLVAVLLSLIPFGSIAQDNPVKPDGRMWGAWGNSTSQSFFIKGAYVEGAIEGLRVGATVGYFAGRLDEQDDALEYLKPCLKGPCAGIPIASLIRTEPNMADEFAGADRVQGKYATPNTSIVDIVHQMDRFYSDYKNTPVCLIVALQESISSLHGTSMSEQELETVRTTRCKP
jgi:hypothetical protein